MWGDSNAVIDLVTGHTLRPRQKEVRPYKL
jgi:hypothetical protein